MLDQIKLRSHRNTTCARKQENINHSALKNQDNYLSIVPSLVPNVVIGTENVVTHALPNLSEEKKEEDKRGGKEGKSAFFLWAS